MTAEERQFAIFHIKTCIEKLCKCSAEEAEELAVQVEYDIFTLAGGELLQCYGCDGYSTRFYETIAYLQNHADKISDAKDIRAINFGEIWDCSIQTPQLESALEACQTQYESILNQLQEPKLKDQQHERCGRCLGRQIIVDCKQNRRGDEMPTTMYRCLNCNKQWTRS